MAKNWYIVNIELFKMEEKKDKIETEKEWKEWVKEWNSLVDKSKGIPGCINREKYDTSFQKEREARKKKSGDGDNVPTVHGHMAEEKAL